MRIHRFFVNIAFIAKNIISIFKMEREKTAARLLIRNALKISTAESCTGGLISSRLTDVSGSSAFIMQNFVTYANETKIRLLGVNRDTIDKHGVVSEEVASEMAQGLLKNYDCKIALSTTGIAGPLGATETKPVGLVCIAVSDGNNTKTCSFFAEPMLNRRIMKLAFSNKALEFLIEFLKENY